MMDLDTLDLKRKWDNEAARVNTVEEGIAKGLAEGIAEGLAEGEKKRFPQRYYRGIDEAFS